MPVKNPTAAPTAALVNPTAPTATATVSAGNLNGTYFYKVTFVGPWGESHPSPASASAAPASKTVDLSAIPTGPTGTTARNIYRAKTLVGNAYGLVATIANNSATTLSGENALDATQTAGAAPPTGNPSGSYQYAMTFFSPSLGESPLGPATAAQTPSSQAVLLTNVPAIPSGVSEVRIYRSKSGGPFQLVSRVNTSLGQYLDNVADGAVVGAAPIGALFTPTIPSGTQARITSGNVAAAGQKELRGSDFGLNGPVARRSNTKAQLWRQGTICLG